MLRGTQRKPVIELLGMTHIAPPTPNWVIAIPPYGSWTAGSDNHLWGMSTPEHRASKTGCSVMSSCAGSRGDSGCDDVGADTEIRVQSDEAAEDALGRDDRIAGADRYGLWRSRRSCGAADCTSEAERTLEEHPVGRTTGAGEGNEATAGGGRPEVGIGKGNGHKTGGRHDGEGWGSEQTHRLNSGRGIGGGLTGDQTIGVDGNVPVLTADVLRLTESVGARDNESEGVPDVLLVDGKGGPTGGKGSEASARGLLVGGVGVDGNAAVADVGTVAIVRVHAPGDRTGSLSDDRTKANLHLKSPLQPARIRIEASVSNKKKKKWRKKRGEAESIHMGNEQVQRTYLIGGENVKVPDAGGAGKRSLRNVYLTMQGGIAETLFICPKSDRVLKCALQQAWVETERVLRALGPAPRDDSQMGFDV